MKTAIVHDWLTGMRGGEKVLEELCDLFPDAPIYTLFHLPGSVSEKIESHPIVTSFLQKAPLVEKNYRNYLPLFPRAMERLNLQDFDLIVSSSHCVAKGVIPNPSAFHLCYCHTPMRYIWSHYDDYFGDHRTAYWKRKMLPRVINYLRSWDVMSNDRVHWFAANSKTVQDRIEKYYGRESSVIHPSVDLDFFQPPESENRQDFYLIVSALVPYKRIDLAIEAFNDSPHELVIVGSGPDEAHLKSKVRSSKIRFLGRVDRNKLLELYQTAQALVQPGIEDFGINMVEAIAAGCPVIAYAAGGALESVEAEQTGLFFNDLRASNLLQTVDKARGLRFNKSLMRESVLRFSPARFKSELNSLIQEKLR
jgi:glycosyltransferase involved in cell wall biosynthesis